MKANGVFYPMSKAKKELFFSIGIFIFFAIGLYMATQINVTFQANVGWADAKTFPYIFLGLGVVFSVVLIIQNVLKLKAERTENPEKGALLPEQEQGIDRASDWKTRATLGLCLVFVLLVPFLGVVVAGWIYLLPQIYVLMPAEKRCKKNYIIGAVIAILFPFIIYLPFRYIFEAFLPMGILKNLF